MQRDPRIFEKLAAQGKLTTDGKEWLTAALDPFHDWNKPLAGYPDADGSSTIVQCFQYSADVTSAGGVNWDCHISTNPIFDTSTSTSCTSVLNENSVQSSVITDTYGQGVLNIVSVPSGTDSAPNGTAAWNPAGLVIANLGVNADVISNNSRVIAMGFEVINTTAELNKQGTCLCYRLPSNQIYTQTAVTNVAGTASGSSMFTKVREAPNSTASANLLRGTTQWRPLKDAMLCVRSLKSKILSLVFLLSPACVLSPVRW